MAPFLQDEIRKIKNILEEGKTNVFLEVKDNFIRDYIEKELIDPKNGKVLFLKTESRDYDTFVSDLGNKVAEIYRKLMRGGAFTNVTDQNLSPQSGIIRAIEFLMDYSKLVLIVDNIESARGSLINFINDISNIMSYKKGATLLIANSLLYTTEGREDLKKIKESPRTYNIIIENPPFEDYRAVLEKDYFIPLNVAYEIYVRSRGNLDNTFSFLTVLKRKGLIDKSGKWNGPEHFTDSFPDTQDELFSYRFKILEDSVKSFARWLSIFEEGVNPDLLHKMCGLSDSVFVNSLETLRGMNLVEIDGDSVHYKDESFRKYVESTISGYSLVKMAKLAISSIQSQSPSAIRLYLFADEVEKAQELALKITRNINSKNLIRSKEIIEDVLEKKKTERLLTRYARILLYQGLNIEAEKVLAEIQRDYPEPGSGFYSLRAWLIAGQGPEERFEELAKKATEEHDKDWILFYKMYFLWQKGDVEGVKSVGGLLIQDGHSDEIRAQALRILGNIYFEQKKMEESLDYYNRGLSLASGIPDTKNVARLLNNIANVFVEKDPRKALELLNEAIKVSVESLDMEVHSIIQFNIVQIEYEAKISSASDAINKLRQMESSYEQYSTLYSKINFYISLAEMLVYSLNLDETLPILEKAERLMQQLGNKWDKLRVDSLKEIIEILKGDSGYSGTLDVDDRSVYNYIMLNALTGRFAEILKVRNLLKTNSNLDKLMNVLISFLNGMDVNEYYNEIKENNEDIYLTAALNILSLKKERKLEINHFIRSGMQLYLLAIARFLDSNEKKRVLEELGKIKCNIGIEFIEKARREV